MKTSAGCVVRARFPDGTRYLLVHPSGNYNRRAPWSLPKGEPEPGEDPVVCALRETREETGVECRVVRDLGEIVYRKTRKRVLAWLAEPADPPTESVLPPASWEVDRVEYLPETEARERIHPDLVAFLDRATAEDEGRAGGAGSGTVGGEARPE